MIREIFTKLQIILLQTYTQNSKLYRELYYFNVACITYNEHFSKGDLPEKVAENVVKNLISVACIPVITRVIYIIRPKKLSYKKPCITATMIWNRGGGDNNRDEHHDGGVAWWVNPT